MPFAGLELGLSSLTAATSRTTATGADGTLDLPRLLPGSYTLSARWTDRGPPLRSWTFDLSPTATGVFEGACAEFCGLHHADMRFSVKVVEPSEYAAWASRTASAQTEQEESL